MASVMYSREDLRAVYGEPWLQIPCSERIVGGWMDGGLPDDVRRKCLALGDGRVHGIQFLAVSESDATLFLMVKHGRPFVNIYGETVTNYWFWLYDDTNDTLELVGSDKDVSRHFYKRLGGPRIDPPEGFYAPRRCHIRKFLLPTRNVFFYEFHTNGGFTLAINGIELEKRNPERTPALAELLDIALAKEQTEEGA